MEEKKGEESFFPSSPLAEDDEKCQADRVVKRARERCGEMARWRVGRKEKKEKKLEKRRREIILSGKSQRERERERDRKPFMHNQI